MANSIFNSMMSNNPYANMIGQIRQFGQSIQGDPKQLVERMLASGQMSQQEFNRYTQITQQILPFM